MKRAILILGVLAVAGCAKDADRATIADRAPLTPKVAQAESGAINADFPMGVTLSMETALDCANSPGPMISLNGELALSGLNGKLIFRNNAKGTHERTEDLVFDIVLIPEGTSIEFNKQPPLGGVGGNPHIWFQLTDAEGGAISDEFYLGRCVQGSK